ncbi:MAG: malonyl-ACP O-methyltransferase BioC [Proteobacteria bacterium]|nr:malonyl-ACP O-methyltransferase BioC [Pseudomonadota bacterium]
MNFAPPPALDKRRVATSFDRAARSYDRHDFLQREVAARAIERLDYVNVQPGHILDLGSGTGRCARALASRYKRAQVVQCDLALGMLRQARSLERRFFSRQRFVAGDFERLPFRDGQFHMAVSSLALQWSQNLEAAFTEVRRSLAVGGLFMFTTLGPDTLRELRKAWTSVSSAPNVNQFLDMHDIGDTLLRAGFGDPVMETEYLTVPYDDLITLMRDLKGIGASNSHADRARGMLGRKRLAALEAAYEAERRDDGKLPATYEVVYGHAWAIEGRRRQPQDVHTFPLEKLRRR